MRAMTRLGLIVGIVGGLCLQAPAVAQEEAAAKAKKGKHVGVANCGKCHKSKSKGDQLGKWKESKHAQAYAVLATDEAKKVAKEAGVEGDPQKADACLQCHVTAHGVEAGMIEPIPEGKKGYSIEDGVGCESCHGAGSLYKSRKIMKDKKAAEAVGLDIPSEETCKQCHNEKSPTYKEFNYEEMLEKIAHPNPKKAAAEEG